MDVAVPSSQAEQGQPAAGLESLSKALGSAGMLMGTWVPLLSTSSTW